MRCLLFHVPCLHLMEQCTLQGTNANEYKIMDNTDIHNINMKKLLSHIEKKMPDWCYLAHKLLQHAHQTSQKYVVAWRAEAAASHCAVDFLSSTQEESRYQDHPACCECKRKRCNKTWHFCTRYRCHCPCSETVSGASSRIFLRAINSKQGYLSDEYSCLLEHWNHLHYPHFMHCPVVTPQDP